MRPQPVDLRIVLSDLPVPPEAVLTVAAVIVVAVLVTISISRARRRRRHAALEERFGGEYERTLVSSGTHRRAEHELQHRLEQRRSVDVHPLDAQQRGRFRSRLRQLEPRFLERPDATAMATLDLALEVAGARGYPDTDLERCLDFLSVDHPQFIADLRREMANRGSTSTTERQRRVVLRARTLIERLLSDGSAEEEPVSWTELWEVVDARPFTTMFQPILSLDDGRTHALEALTRFDLTPPRSPEVWFAKADEVGLGTELELAAIDAALAAADEVPDEIAVSVNASPQTLSDPRLQRLLDAHPRRQVILEVTEHAIVQDYEGMTAALRPLRERGALLAVDDAGAGISSLRHIVRLTPEMIKLDHSLTQEVLADPVRQALASSLVHFAHRIGAQLIVEGIEEASDLAAWQDLGAHGVQGDLLAPAGELPAPVSSAHIVPRPRAFATEHASASAQGETTETNEPHGASST